VERGQLEAAVSIARIAHDRNPLAVDPLFTLASIEVAAGRPERARTALEQATEREPANPEPWTRLGRLKLHQLGDPKGALRAFQVAYYLDPYSVQRISDVVVAARTVNGG
jgi:cytochrome c-type biogenesis protein CcmH/NrfG